MITAKYFFILTIIASLLVLDGCTTRPVTNTTAMVNTNDNTNTAIEINTNETVTNDNTNTMQESEVDTSDWLTYTNEKYGFSFRYPGSLESSDLNETNYVFALDILTKDKDAVTGRGQSIIFIGIPNGPQKLESEISSFIGVKEETIQINGYPARQYTFYQGMEEDAIKPHNTKRIFIEHNSETVMISQTDFNTNDDYDNWFNNIIGTLIFF